RDNFVDYVEIVPQTGRGAKKGMNFTVVGAGTVFMNVTVNGSQTTLIFRDAVHAPDLRANLISVPRMDLAGYEVSMRNGTARV
ncbi:hypothetical protein OE88DRAFT_1603380, partial [Heliocybe sulcata]